MKLYDGIISDTEALLAQYEPRIFPYDRERIWKDRGVSELILLRDAAFELGGRGHASVGYLCATTAPLFDRDEIYVYGPDLPEITGDTDFAKIVYLVTDDLREDSDSEAAFRTVRNMNFVRYHVFPAGYMVRVSSESNEEQVRVSKKVVRAGIRFSYVGATYIRKYRELPEVKHVRVIFITEPSLVAALRPNAAKVDDITKTLTHILDGLPTDCGHCSMKAVCDEVEGMRELHLGKKK